MSNEKVIQFEVDEAGKARIDMLLKRLKKIDAEAVRIGGNAEETNSSLPAPVNREAKRIAQKHNRLIGRLRGRIDNLTAERAEIVREINVIREGGGI